MRIAKADLKRNIARYGARWGIIPIFSIWGDVLAAEKIPVKIPLAGFSVVFNLVSDITAVDRNFPFKSLIAARKMRHERSISRRQDLALMIRAQRRQQRLAEIKAEMKLEQKKLLSGRQIFIPR